MAAKTPLALVSGEVENFQSGDFVPIANGGTGATTQGGAQTALGLAIGTNVQAWDADLDAIASISTVGQLQRTGAGSWVAGGTAIVNCRVASTGNVSVSSAPSTIDGVTLAASDLILLKNQTTGSENGVYVFSAAASALTRSSLLNVSAQAVPGLLITVSEGTANSDSLWMLTTNGSITIGSTSLSFQSFANQYTTVNARLTSTANIASLASPGTTLDSVTMATGDVVLLKNQTTASQNGLYTYTGSSLTRLANYPTGSIMPAGMTVTISEGTLYGASMWSLLTTGTVTVDTTNQSWGSDGAAFNTENILLLDNPVANPTAAPSGSLKVFTQATVSKQLLKSVTPNELITSVQQSLDEGNHVVFMNAGGSTLANLGVSWASFGAVSAPSLDTTNAYTILPKTRWANVATTTNQSLGIGTAAVSKTFWRGNASGLGGFFFHAKWAVGLWPATTVRVFVGLTSVAFTTSTGEVASDTLSGDCCGFSHITTDAATTITFATRDNSTTNRTTITLGTALQAGRMYESWIYCAPNGGTIFYRLDDILAGTTLVDSSTTTNIPRNSVFLGPELAMSNGTANTTAKTTAFELIGFQCSDR